MGEASSGSVRRPRTTLCLGIGRPTAVPRGSASPILPTRRSAWFQRCPFSAGAVDSSVGEVRVRFSPAVGNRTVGASGILTVRVGAWGSSRTSPGISRHQYRNFPKILRSPFTRSQRTQMTLYSSVRLSRLGFPMVSGVLEHASVMADDNRPSPDSVWLRTSAEASSFGARPEPLSGLSDSLLTHRADVVPEELKVMRLETPTIRIRLDGDGFHALFRREARRTAALQVIEFRHSRSFIGGWPVTFAKRALFAAISSRFCHTFWDAPARVRLAMQSQSIQFCWVSLATISGLNRSEHHHLGRILARSWLGGVSAKALYHEAVVAARSATALNGPGIDHHGVHAGQVQSKKARKH